MSAAPATAMFGRRRPGEPEPRRRRDRNRRHSSAAARSPRRTPSRSAARRGSVSTASATSSCAAVPTSTLTVSAGNGAATGSLPHRIRGSSRCGRSGASAHCEVANQGRQSSAEARSSVSAAARGGGGRGDRRRHVAVGTRHVAATVHPGPVVQNARRGPRRHCADVVGQMLAAESCCLQAQVLAARRADLVAHYRDHLNGCCHPFDRPANIDHLGIERHRRSLSYVRLRNLPNTLNERF